VRSGITTLRLPHTNRYSLTSDGIRIAVVYTKACNRLLVPLTAANQPQTPPELRAALAAITATSMITPTRRAFPRRVKLDTNADKLTTKVSMKRPAPVAARKPDG
jgi:hypothetical protein